MYLYAAFDLMMTVIDIWKRIDHNAIYRLRVICKYLYVNRENRLPQYGCYRFMRLAERVRKGESLWKGSSSHIKCAYGEELHLNFGYKLRDPSSRKIILPPELKTLVFCKKK